jgi:hypothetical protein
MFTAYDVYKHAAGSDGSGTAYGFSVSKDRLVKELRAFTDKIESDEYVFQKIESSVIGVHDDFTISVMRIEFVEKIKKQTP